MTLTRLWLRIEWRRSLTSLIVIAVLLALSAGAVLAALAGVRRAGSAQERLAQTTLPMDLLIAPDFTSPLDLKQVAALPQVVAMDSVVEYGFVFDGIPVAEGRAGNAVTMVMPYGEPGGDQLLRTVERPVILHGRLPRPDRADEAAVTSGFVSSFGRGIGDVLHPALAPGQQLPGQGLLPRDVRIVGVIRSPLFSDDATTKGKIALTPALASILSIDPHAYKAPLVRLRGGAGDAAAFIRRLQALPGGATASILDAGESTRRRQHVLDFENRFLLAVAGCLLLAALVLIGQATARIATTTAAELRPLRALGLTYRQIVVLAAAGPLVAGVTGAIAGVALAAVASPLFPLGSAAAYEPRPGFDLDWLVLGAGLVLSPLVAVVPALLGAGIALFSAGRPQTAGWQSPIADRMARLGLPVPVVVGTRFALERQSGGLTVPSRSAQAGAVLGVLGVTAALTFTAAVSEAAGNPARFGQTFQVSVPLSTGDPQRPGVRPGLTAGSTDERVLAALEQDRDVAAVNDSASSGGTLAGADLVLNRYQPGKGQPGVVLTSGRMPEAAGEVVLGPESATVARIRPGQQVRLRSSGGERRLTVTGLGLVPESFRGSYAEGAWLSPAGYAALVAPGDGEHNALISVRAGAALPAVVARLNQTVAQAAGFTAATPPPEQVYQVYVEHEPARAGEVRRVRAYPIVLGVLLGVLALAAVGHGLASAARRRQPELAVLRAVGMTPRQSWTVIASQAAVLSVIGLAAGVPLGLGLGRALWRAVASYTPLEYAAPEPWLALAAIGPGVLLFALLLAAWPGYHAGRFRLAYALRAE